MRSDDATVVPSARGETLSSRPPRPGRRRPRPLSSEGPSSAADAGFRVVAVAGPAAASSSSTPPFAEAPGKGPPPPRGASPRCGRRAPEEATRCRLRPRTLLPALATLLLALASSCSAGGDRPAAERRRRRSVVDARDEEERSATSVLRSEVASVVGGGIGDISELDRILQSDGDRRTQRVEFEPFAVTIGPTPSQLSFEEEEWVANVVEDVVSDHMEAHFLTRLGSTTFEYAVLKHITVVMHITGNNNGRRLEEEDAVGEAGQREARTAPTWALAGRDRRRLAVDPPYTLLEFDGGIASFDVPDADGPLPTRSELDALVLEAINDNDDALLKALASDARFQSLGDAEIVVPTARPTTVPSAGPTADPSSSPSLGPTTDPTRAPTTSPTTRPSEAPTAGPSASPTEPPSLEPTPPPTESPSLRPSVPPTKMPTSRPSTPSPTAAPVVGQTPFPTNAPTRAPSLRPSGPPTKAPSDSPSTPSPTGSPVVGQTPIPTKAPTMSPTSDPRKSPTPSPSARPSATPSEASASIVLPPPPRVVAQGNGDAAGNSGGGTSAVVGAAVASAAVASVLSLLFLRRRRSRQQYWKESPADKKVVEDIGHEVIVEDPSNVAKGAGNLHARDHLNPAVVAVEIEVSSDSGSSKIEKILAAARATAEQDATDNVAAASKSLDGGVPKTLSVPSSEWDEDRMADIDLNFVDPPPASVAADNDRDDDAGSGIFTVRTEASSSICGDGGGTGVALSTQRSLASCSTFPQSSVGAHSVESFERQRIEGVGAALRKDMLRSFGEGLPPVPFRSGAADGAKSNYASHLLRQRDPSIRNDDDCALASTPFTAASISSSSPSCAVPCGGGADASSVASSSDHSGFVNMEFAPDDAWDPDDTTVHGTGDDEESFLESREATTVGPFRDAKRKSGKGTGGEDRARLVPSSTWPGGGDDDAGEEGEGGRMAPMVPYRMEFVEAPTKRRADARTNSTPTKPSIV